MDKPETVLSQVSAAMRASPALSELEILYAYPGTPVDSPLAYCTVALSTEQIEDKDVKPVYESGTQPPELLYNHVESQRIRMDIYIPEYGSVLRGYEVFSLLNDFWKSDRHQYPFTGAGLKYLKYDRVAGGYIFYAYADLYETSVKAQ